MKRRFTEEQRVKILQEVESGKSIVEVCRTYNISASTFHAWKNRYGGMSVSEVQKLKALEEENRKLKRIVADLTLDNTALKDILSKKW